MRSKQESAQKNLQRIQFSFVKCFCPEVCVRKKTMLLKELADKQ